MEITSTGDNLQIFIHCQDKPEHNWMSFASYYSIIKTLPEAKPNLIIERVLPTRMYFSWANRCHVPCYRFNGDIYDNIEKYKWAEKPYLIIQSNVMAIRELDDQWANIFKIPRRFFIGERMVFNNGDMDDFMDDGLHCADIKSSIAASFTHYHDFGNFVLSEWINTNTSPLPYTTEFEVPTVNAERVLGLWARAARLYSLMER